MTEKNKEIVFKGELRWPVLPPMQPRGPRDEYKSDMNKDDLQYSVQVECPEDLFKKLKKAGIPRGTELKEDDETGKTFINVRGTVQKTRVGGEPLRLDNYGPPVTVVDETGKTVEDMLANGSEGEVTVEMAPNKKYGGYVLRLRKVKVTKLIAYDPDNAPTKEAVVKEASKKNPLEDLNDIF